MAINLAAQKSNYLSNVNTAAQQAVQALQTLARLYQEALDLSYQAGGANAIIDGDIPTALSHLTAANLATGLTQFHALDTNLSANSRAGWIALQALVGNPS